MFFCHFNFSFIHLWSNLCQRLIKCGPSLISTVHVYWQVSEYSVFKCWIFDLRMELFEVLIFGLNWGSWNIRTLLVLTLWPNCLQQCLKLSSNEGIHNTASCKFEDSPSHCFRVHVPRPCRSIIFLILASVAPVSAFIFFSTLQIS